MGQSSDAITPAQREWIAAQRVFFVATAPRADAGHVNCSPKGGDSFRVLGDREVAYADLTGSGVETVAHLQENGRIVVMFCAFAGGPKILRLHGRGEAVTPAHPKFAWLKQLSPDRPGLRAIIRIDVARVGDSCGYAVPFFDYAGPRDTLEKWAEAKGPAGLTDYRAKKNARSLDGLPGLGA